MATYRTGQPQPSELDSNDNNEHLANETATDGQPNEGQGGHLAIETTRTTTTTTKNDHVGNKRIIEQANKETSKDTTPS